MKFKRVEDYLVLGAYLVTGLFLGYSLGKERPVKKPDTVVVDITKEGNEILIYEHYSGSLVFEYNKNKEVDKTAYREFEEVWEEILKSNYLYSPFSQLFFISLLCEI